MSPKLYENVFDKCYIMTALKAQCGKKGTYYLICGNHITPDCFVNSGQYKAKKAFNLCLEKKKQGWGLQPSATQQQGNR